MYKDLSKALIEKYGIDKQLICCIEELSELQKAICKWLRAQKPREECYMDMAEEIADVEITIEHIKNYYGKEFQKVIDDYKVEKISRTRKLVEA